VYDSTEAVRFIQSHDTFVVLGHKEPDGDCVASQISAARLLRSLGKTATLHSVGPFDRPEITPFQSDFSPTVPAEKRSSTAVILLDCSPPDRTGSIGATVAGLPCLVIDHHSSGEPFGDARMVDAAAPSTTVLMLDLFEAMGVTLDADTARLILFGLCTDTGFLRHLGPGSAETYRSIARLVERGTSTADVYMMVYGRRELASRRLLGEMLERTESHRSDRLILTWQTMADRARLGAHQRGEDDLYRLLQTVKGNVVVVLIKEEAEGVFSVGLRSTSAVDVGAVAASFGGGGHKQASGFDIRGSLESVKKAVTEALMPLISNADL
jgi:bifunctional oligoribonuclease and PAP phosphatase NrnA